MLRVFCNYVKCSARETPMVIKEMLGETSLRFIAHCALVGKAFDVWSDRAEKLGKMPVQIKMFRAWMFYFIAMLKNFAIFSIKVCNFVYRENTVECFRFVWRHFKCKQSVTMIFLLNKIEIPLISIGCWHFWFLK